MLKFVREAFRDIKNTGSVWPSSPALASAMTKGLSARTGKRRVLEVGPGTGPFTKKLLKDLRAGDHLDVVEMNELFCESLEKNILAPFRRSHSKIHVELHIFKDLMELLVDGGELVYFEYAGVRVIKGTLVGSKGKKQLKEIRGIRRELFKAHDGRQQLVMANLPPALTVRLRKATASIGAERALIR